MLITAIPQYLQGITNAKVDLTTTNNTTIYTAPSNADFNVSVITSILVSNDSGSNDTITVTLTDTDSAIFSVYKLEEIGALSTKELLINSLVLKGGEILKAQAATAGRLHVIASIQEINKIRVNTSAIS
tara:strand:- start:308 stop:694 length:387 start_codon:yes stop_codon:yes gene_type:complete